jgi:type 1 fimbria pilin
MRHFFSTLLARKMFLPAAIALMALAGAGNATAGMCQFPGNELISFSKVNVQPSAAVGDTLAATTMNFTVTCPTPSSGAGAGYRIGFVTDFNWLASSIPGVWQSNTGASAGGVTGIGVRLTSTTISPLTGTTTMVVSGDATRTCTGTVNPATTACRLSPDQVSPSGFTLNINIKVELVKTANTIGSQTLSVYLVGPFAWDIRNGDHNTASAHQIGGTTFVVPTCTRTSPNPLDVRLPDLTPSQLGSVNATGGDKSFSLDFLCAGGRNVSMTMTDATTGSNNTNQLTLSPGSTATGVKLQVLYKGVPITFNPNSQASGISVGATPGTGTGQAFSIPLTVRYIATGNPGPVTPGTVDAVATFTLSYP